MYDTSFFKDNHKLLDWAKEHVCASRRAKPYVGWDGEVNYVHLSDDLLLLYQLERKPEGLEVVMFHMLLWSELRKLRKDVFRVRKFFRPEGEILWHSAIVYGGRMDLPFAVVNAWQEDEFAKYSEGGCFEMAFSGIGDWLVCNNDKGTIRFYEGNPVEMARKEKNDPTIDHADMFMDELRFLNAGDTPREPARAEFAAIVENCQPLSICGEKCYRLHLWSGPMDSPASFPWDLLVAANRIEGRYVPRTGDMVYGNAFMFGTFWGGAQDEPTVFDEKPGHWNTPDCDGEPGPQMDGEMAADDDAGGDSDDNAVPHAETDEEEAKGWEWLPRKPEEYPDCSHHGGGLHASVKKIFPKYIVYADYRRHLKGALTPVKPPSRKTLKGILDAIDYVVTQNGNHREFADVFETIGVRHMVRDEKTGEYHLWCCLPSGFDRERYRSHLLVALDEEFSVVRYTIHAGRWNRMRMDRGFEPCIYFKSIGDYTYYASMAEAIAHVGEMEISDYLLAICCGPASFVQARCMKIDADGAQHFRIEWQIHDLPWQFYIPNGTRTQFVAMLGEYDKHGVEAVQTMAKWRWCKMKDNW